MITNVVLKLAKAFLKMKKKNKEAQFLTSQIYTFTIGFSYTTTTIGTCEHDENRPNTDANVRVELANNNFREYEMCLALISLSADCRGLFTSCFKHQAIFLTSK